MTHLADAQGQQADLYWKGQSLRQDFSELLVMEHRVPLPEQMQLLPKLHVCALHKHQ